MNCSLWEETMEQYEGKVIRYIDLESRWDIDAYVAGCEFDIGITIVGYKNRDLYLYCLQGPSALPEEYKKDSVYEFYNEKFENIIAMFKEDVFDMDVVREISRKYSRKMGTNVGSHACAFNK